MQRPAATLKQAISWNYISLFFLGICGISITCIIAYFYNASVLGYFNLINAMYMILMQVSTVGIHYSVIMYLSHESHTSDKNGEVILSGVLLAMLINLPFVSLLYFSAETVGAWLHNVDIVSGIQLMAPALFLFSINKILLWALNGLRFARSFALFQTLRYVCILFTILFVSIRQLDFTWLVASFLAAEMVLMIGLCIRFMPIFARQYTVTQAWLTKHFTYGMKGIGSGLFLMLNLNIDLILLGAFVAQHEVGVYSFAAVITIGMYQLLTAIRMSFNPVLATQLDKKDYMAISALITKTQRYVLSFMVVLSVLIIALLPLIISIFLPDKGFMESWRVLCILLVGVVAYSIFFPFDQMLAMGGHPAQQTFYNSLVLTANAMLNLLLIPSFGIYGAAIATTIVSAIISPILLSRLLKFYLQVNVMSMRA